MRRAYRFRLYPKRWQVQRFERDLSLCRRLYNAGLEHRITAYRNGQSVTYLQQANELPAIKRELPEYATVHSQVLQQTLQRLDKAYKNFFRRVAEKRGGKNVKAGFPRFKPSDRFNSLTYPQSGFRLLPDGHLQLSRLGEVRMFMHREPKGKVKTLNVKRDGCGDWYAVLVAERPNPPVKKGRKLVGTDLNINDLIVLSTGEKTPAPHFYQKAEKKLKKRNRHLSKTELGSHRHEKARLKLAKIHRLVERRRTDFHHKLSRGLVENDLKFENLNIAGLVCNHHLSKSILDAAWGRLIGFVVYKAEEAGGQAEPVDPRGSSQECSRCHAHVKIGSGEQVFRCPYCGLVLDRHVNAARVIVGRGTAELRPGKAKTNVTERDRVWPMKREAHPLRGREDVTSYVDAMKEGDKT
jgi:putative transposase